MFVKNNKYEILTENGFSDFDGIQCIEKNEYIHFYFENASELKVSFDHKFFNESDEIIEAISLKKGDLIKSKNGLLMVSDIKKYNTGTDKVKLYDPINVKNGYRYYSNGVLSHNCEFLGSSSTVIDSDVLNNLQNVHREPLLYDLNDKLRVYEKPLNGAKYVLGVDVAKGTGRHYSTVQVLKIINTNPLKLEQVCVYQNNFIDVYKFSYVINKLCHYYNRGYIMCESNNDGSAVVNQLWWEIENENLVNEGGKSKDLGIRATTKTKPKAVLFMKKLIEDYNLILVDRKTIEELNDFIDKGNSRYGANNYDDDLVSALYWATYLFLMDMVDNVDFINDEDKNEDAWGILSDVNDDYYDDDFFIVM